MEIWEDIKRYLVNLKNNGKQYDLYINVAVNDLNLINTNKYKNFINNIENLDIYEDLYVTQSDNRGMDIGGFMTSYIKMLELKNNYTYIIKIHTKTNDNWRFALLYSILGNNKIIDNNFNLLKNDNIGMIGNQTISLSDVINKKSYNFIDEYMNRFKIPLSIKGSFIPGTIFIIKNEILQKYFTINKLKDCYNEFKQDYCGLKDNIKEGKPHAFERFFGVLVENYGKKTVSFDIGFQK